MTVRSGATTLCGMDLHILKDDVPTADSGWTLGHKAAGTIVEFGGQSVKTGGTKPSSRASSPATISSCEWHYGGP
ncbi:MAG: alcohol dehydrogenase catalytic domain-containing protein [Rubrobacter sp.]